MASFKDFQGEKIKATRYLEKTVKHENREGFHLKTVMMMNGSEIQMDYQLQVWRVLQYLEE